jgi:hypothetical protein
MGFFVITLTNFTNHASRLTIHGINGMGFFVFLCLTPDASRLTLYGIKLTPYALRFTPYGKKGEHLNN